MELQEFKTLLDKQGEAFVAFKTSHDEQIAELKKSGSNDPILVERLGKIEKSLASPCCGGLTDKVSQREEAFRRDRQDV